MWEILRESAVFILVGFLIAGLLDAMVSSARVVRYLSAKRSRSVFLATLVGAPASLCSCSVLPTALTLRRKGASKGATLSFLIASPEISGPSVLLTYSLLGGAMAIFRPIAACITAVTAGLVENFIDRRFPDSPPAIAAEPAAPAACCASARQPATPPPCCASSPNPAAATTTTALPIRQRVRAGLRFAFVDLFDSLFGWILFGIAAAAAIQAWLPPDVLNQILGGQVRSMLLMVLIGVPLYVCAEASTPIAAVLIANGVSPGAAIVFLLVGPATNIGSLGVLWHELGRRTVIVYLATIILVSLLMGLLANDLLGGAHGDLQHCVLKEQLLPAWLKTGGAAVFLAIGLGTVWRRPCALPLSTVALAAGTLHALPPVANAAITVHLAGSVHADQRHGRYTSALPPPLR